MLRDSRVTESQLAECLAEQRARRLRGERPLLGEILREKGYATGDEVQSILQAQRRLSTQDRDLRFGTIAVDLGLLGPRQVEEALAYQEGGEVHRRLGEILVGKGWLTEAQVQAVLAEQERRRGVV
ncbi:MAG: hypothetical protein HY722_15265 [Planctomycetes bacterium]|nr:hypothetical protein [Planctomycetota bacterium]